MSNAGHMAEIWALTGAVGGVGVTSLAIQSALSAIRTSKAETGKQIKACVIDLDFDCGAVTSYLDMPARLSLAHLSFSSGDIDGPITEALVQEHSSGIHILACAPEVGGNDKVNADRVLQLLDATSTMFDLIILDIPRIWRPWTQAAYAAADSIGIVTEMNIPALNSARRVSQDIGAYVPNAPIEFILNRFERRVLKSTLSLKDAKRALNVEPRIQICPDPTALNHALNCGEPVEIIHADSRYVKDVANFVRVWRTGQEEVEDSSSRPRSMWRKRVA